MSSVDKSWVAKFKDALDMKTIAIALIVLTYVVEKVWGYIEVGAQTEFEASVAKTFTGSSFYNAVDSVFTVKITDPAILNKILTSTEVVKFSDEAGDKIRNAIIEDVMRQDTNKISMRAFIGMKIKMRDEDVLPALAELMNAWNKVELMTKEQADVYVTRKVKSLVEKDALKDVPSF